MGFVSVLWTCARDGGSDYNLCFGDLVTYFARGYRIGTGLFVLSNCFLCQNVFHVSLVLSRTPPVSPPHGRILLPESF